MYCPMPSELENIRAQAGIEPTTLGVLAHYSNHWATEALVVEWSLFDCISNFLFIYLFLCAVSASWPHPERHNSPSIYELFNCMMLVYNSAIISNQDRFA